MTKEMMSTKEVADYLNINEKQVYKLIKGKKIPASRATGKWTFPKALIDEWIINSAKETVSAKKRLELKDHIVVMGSNDFSMELLSHELNLNYPEFSLSLSNVGSVQGLIALSRGICQVASCHLLDPETGTYNLSYLPRYLPDTETVVINLVYRDLGLVVRRGNPLKMSAIQDLSKPGVTIINRQQGSGTRTFLDFELLRLGMDPQKINGYHHEVNTHTETAITVLSGSADVGIGILPAAKMLGLDFIHLTKERYDLIIPRENLSVEPIDALLKVVRSQEFKMKIQQLGGYDTIHTGAVMST